MMGKYTFKLDKYEIRRTRSMHKDTNYITATLRVNDQLIGAPQTKFMGDQNDGTYPVNFIWADVDVPYELPHTTVKLHYQIMNSGHKNHAEVQEAMTAVAQQPTTADWKIAVGKWLAAKTIKLLFADCDGPIAPPEGRIIVWHSFELNQSAPGATGEEVMNENGNDSPEGCGRNSHYRVHFSTTRH